MTKIYYNLPLNKKLLLASYRNKIKYDGQELSFNNFLRVSCMNDISGFFIMTDKLTKQYDVNDFSKFGIDYPLK